MTLISCYDKYLIGYTDKFGKRQGNGDEDLKTALISAKFNRRFHTKVSITKISVWPHRSLRSSLCTIVGIGHGKIPVGFGVHESIRKLAWKKRKF